MDCKCCSLEAEVNDGADLRHYCYVRDCGLNPSQCANAFTLKKEGMAR